MNLEACRSRFECVVAWRQVSKPARKSYSYFLSFKFVVIALFIISFEISLG
ncbi:hypothetical protein Scep_030360 [Stephania cephalantha]|uniref:Uncharacterized protein n=1 Tax=Stephania cephalantha TaxID=152367 RepID=A0AAP0E745_9MAGN